MKTLKAICKTPLGSFLEIGREYTLVQELSALNANVEIYSVYDNEGYELCSVHGDSLHVYFILVVEGGSDPHTCQWNMYKGFTEVYEYCYICDDKRYSVVM